MKDQTKLVEKIFEADSKEKSYNEFYVSKLLNVSDPHNWYYSDKIICEMFHPKYWNDTHDKDTVRIMFKSYDDFMMYRDFNYYDLKGNWSFCMEHYYNELPDTVDVEWLYRHGYVPF